MSPIDDDVSTVLNPSFDPSAQGETFQVRVVHGVEAGARREVDGPVRILVGTGPTADLRLSDPKVSRRHLAIEVVGRELCIEDLESKNGTFIGGVRVERAFVNDRAMIHLGDTILSVEATHATPRPLPNAQSFGKIFGASREMRAIYPLLERLAASDVPVVIEGETGTGKEVVAESLHEASRRASAPFVVFDCTAVPPSLVEAELFGHERGAFTGATALRRGVFEQAHGGTLLIDEIGDLEPAMQPKLLRAIERSEVRRVGGEKWLKLDVRIICATRRDLELEVESGRFRDDLFHRLAVGRVELPPLRRRRGDVPLLVAEFARQTPNASPIPPSIVATWDRAPWPGNVRELRNAVARYIALGDEYGNPAPTFAGDPIDVVIKEGLAFTEGRERVIAEYERRFVEAALEKHGGNVSRAAAASGLARRYFQILRSRSR